MRRTILVLGVIAAMLLLNLTAAYACGDKSLRIGRGVRFQRTQHPASILIYIPSSASGNVAKVGPLQSLLKSVGHKAARPVRGFDQLEQALQSGHYDLILSSLTEVDGLQRHLASSTSKPVLVPVAPSKAPKTEVKAAEKQYRYIVKDSGNPTQYLTAIERAMKARQGVQAKV